MRCCFLKFFGISQLFHKIGRYALVERVPDFRRFKNESARIDAPKDVVLDFNRRTRINDIYCNLMFLDAALQIARKRVESASVKLAQIFEVLQSEGLFDNEVFESAQAL